MINIQTVTVADIPEVLAFVLAARAELFPKLSDTRMPADLAQFGIRVNAICPGFITTNIFTASLGLTGDAEAQAKAAIAQMASHAQPVARAGQPDDIANAVIFLAGETSGFMTGTHLLVDGGMTIGQRHSWDPEAPGIFDALQAVADGVEAQSETA